MWNSKQTHIDSVSLTELSKCNAHHSHSQSFSRPFVRSFLKWPQILFTRNAYCPILFHSFVTGLSQTMKWCPLLRVLRYKKGWKEDSKWETTQKIHQFYWDRGNAQNGCVSVGKKVFESKENSRKMHWLNLLRCWFHGQMTQKPHSWQSDERDLSRQKACSSVLAPYPD